VSDTGDRTPPTAQAKEWRDFHETKARTNHPKWPNEAMVKVLFGSYASEPPSPGADWHVLDVGCGFANNLLPFLDLGCACSGVEVDTVIAELAQGIIRERGFTADIRAGDNTHLPFGDGEFDLLLSVNTIHYQGTREEMRRALAEFRRMLRPGGWAYLSTVGPDHTIRRRAADLGDGCFRIQNFDFRDGQQFFFFDDRTEFERELGSVFASVEVGRVTEDLMTLPLDFLVALVRA
tara:strand:+ start:32877 stop:33581 length:705 start_codon:yes stop_codon:yes gene_type:complete